MAEDAIEIEVTIGSRDIYSLVERCVSSIFISYYWFAFKVLLLTIMYIIVGILVNALIMVLYGEIMDFFQFLVTLSSAYFLILIQFNYKGRKVKAKIQKIYNTYDEAVDVFYKINSTSVESKVGDRKNSVSWKNISKLNVSNDYAFLLFDAGVGGLVVPLKDIRGRDHIIGQLQNWFSASR
ncbi:MAG: hypothetical protein ACRBDL_09200 [Alphaproteobacteria bacterium]